MMGLWACLKDLFSPVKNIRVACNKCGWRRNGYYSYSAMCYSPALGIAPGDFNPMSGTYDPPCPIHRRCKDVNFDGYCPYFKAKEYTND